MPESNRILWGQYLPTCTSISQIYCPYLPTIPTIPTYHTYLQYLPTIPTYNTYHTYLPYLQYLPTIPTDLHLYQPNLLSIPRYLLQMSGYAVICFVICFIDGPSMASFKFIFVLLNHQQNFYKR